LEVLSRVCPNRFLLFPEPVFVNFLRSPGIDSQPGRPVRQPYLSYRPTRLHGLAELIPRNRFLCFLNVYKYGLRVCPLVYKSWCHQTKFLAVPSRCRQIRLIEGNAKSFRFTSSNLEKDFAAALYLAGTPPLLEFCLGVVKQLCRCRIWSHTECKSTASMYCIHGHLRGGGGVNWNQCH
jgi:hypothetical protein